MLDYKVMAENESMYNTPPCWPIYMCGLTFKKLLRDGGLQAMQERNEKKVRFRTLSSGLPSVHASCVSVQHCDAGGDVHHACRKQFCMCLCMSMSLRCIRAACIVLLRARPRCCRLSSIVPHSLP